MACIEDQSAVIPALEGRWSDPADGVLGLIEGGEAALAAFKDAVQGAGAAARVDLARLDLQAPIPRPRKNIVCLGWNYAEHAHESAAAQGRSAVLPEVPVVFTKAVTSVTGPTAEIPYDEGVSAQLDWEVELAVVLGRGGRHISEARALEHVFGYTVINDVSARDIQFRHKQYFLGKSLDGACPMGPWIVTRDELPDPQSLDLSCRVNDEQKQHSNTRHQIFSVARTISILSRCMTLEPGDIIATGTPSGVGFARNPPEFLKPGDVVKCEIAGIGALENRVVDIH